MCGVAGYLHLKEPGPPDEALLRTMLGLLRHRGPDEFGIYADRRVGLGSARLSIIDLETGTQPISSEDGTVWVVFNGEVFNHRSLRSELEAKGHSFSTSSDTEVVVHLYEELGPACVEPLNGQFAFAVWDRRVPGDERLVLARDRVGIRPLFYTTVGGTLLFASEIKALFSHRDVNRRFDPRSLAQILTLWTTIGSRTAFAGIHQVPPGHVLTATRGGVRVERYWDHDFARDDPPLSTDEYAEHLRELLDDATRLRLNADVDVGTYLSGGLDSSTISRLAVDRVGSRLRTFSIEFSHPAFDERIHQIAMADALGTEHATVACDDDAIANALPGVVRHAESPILRSAPAPMFLLSRLVNEHGIKVVLTGEGADELLGGYNIFKEDRVRRFWARQPDSTIRPLLLKELYPYVADLGTSTDYLTAFFGKRLTETDSPVYSHLIRWANGAHLRRMLSSEIRAEIADYDPVDDITGVLEEHPHFSSWSPLARAQYIELTLFMPGYLLSSQGDRMLMAHSVEGRFPFLDHRVVELASRMPDRAKLCGLNEKTVLKRAMRHSLPASVVQRTKQPFRAPIRSSFRSDRGRALLDVLSPESVARAGVFSPAAMTALVAKTQRPVPPSERDDMALVASVSTMLLHQMFVAPSLAVGAPKIRLKRRVIRDVVET